MSVRARLEAGPFDPSVELANLIEAASNDGAVVSFVGVARPQSKDGANVDWLVLEHHPRLTLNCLLYTSPSPRDS